MYTSSNNNFGHPLSMLCHSLMKLEALSWVKDAGDGCLWSSIGYQQCLSVHVRAVFCVIWRGRPQCTVCNLCECCTYFSFKSGLPLSIFLSLSLTHFQRHMCSHKQMCCSLCVASFIQFYKCTWVFTVMLTVAVMWSNCSASVMVNKRKLCSAEIVKKVGPRQWLWWMQQQLVWHRRRGEKEENNL